MTETREATTDRADVAPAVAPVRRAVLTVVGVLAALGACFGGAYLRGGEGAGVRELLLAAAGLIGVAGLVCVVMSLAIRPGGGTEG